MFVTLESKSYKFMKFTSGQYYYYTANPEICKKVEVTELKNKYITLVNDY